MLYQGFQGAMKCPFGQWVSKGRYVVSLGHGVLRGSLEAPISGDRTAKCSLVQQWLNAMNAPQSSYRKYLLTSSYLMFRAPPEDRTDGATSFSRWCV